MKKLFATVLALVMMLSVMSVTAFAAPTAKSADLDGHTYKAFQVFKGTQAAGDTTGKLADVQWGSGVDGAALLTALKDDATLGTIFASCTTAADVAAKMAGWADSSDKAKAFAKLAYDNKTGDGTACVNGETSLDAGYYLVVDTTTPSGTDFVSNLALLQLTNKSTFDIANKVDVPEVEKKIMEGTTPVDANSASIGDEVKYQITGTMPTDIADYGTYFYQFTDTMSKGLTYKADSLKITVGDKDVTSYFYKDVSTYNATTGTTIKVTIADLLALNNVAGVTIDKNSTVVLTYTATLNDNAVVAGAGNDNKVDLTYSNNPSNSGKPTDTPPTPPTTPPEPEYPTGKTPEDKVVTYTTELTVLKTDENSNKLTGAEFQLSGEGANIVITTGTNYVKDDAGTFYKLKDNTYTTTAPTTDSASKYASTTDKYKEVTTVSYDTKDSSVKAKAFVDSDGKVTFTGLGAGDYTLTETVVPAGYNGIDPINFTVSFDKSTAKFSADNGISVDGATNLMSTTIKNQSGSTLPETGGIGTRIFYAVGGIMLVGAAVMLVAKKRMDAED